MLTDDHLIRSGGKHARDGARARKPEEGPEAGEDGLAGWEGVRAWLGRQAPLMVAMVAGVVLVAGTIGPPLVGRGVFLGTDLLYLASPWEADPHPPTIGRSGPVSDTLDAIYPDRATFSRELRHGELVEWNPWIAGGHPLGATSHSGTLSPFALPYHLAPAWYAPALVKLLGMAAAIGSSYLFCRQLRLDRVPALFAGLAFAGSGFMVMWTNWPQVDVAAAIPALFWASERYLQRRRLSSLVPLALTTAVMLLGNFPAVTGYALYALAPYVALRLLSPHPDDRSTGPLADFRDRLPLILKTGLGVATGLAAGTALVAAVLLPFAARLGDTDLDYRDQGPDANLGIPALLTTVAPEAFGFSSDGGVYHGPAGNQVEGVAFVGVSTALLVLVALALPATRRMPVGAGPALVGTTLVLGWATFVGHPVLGLLQNLPVFTDNFVGRTRSILGFTVAVLAAMGLQRVLDHPGRLSDLIRRPRAGVRAAAVVVGAAVVTVLVLVRSVEWVRPFGGGSTMGGALVLPTVIGILAIGAMMLLRVRRWSWARPLGTAALPVLLTVEAVALAAPLLPNNERRTVYPETPGTELLQANVGHDRVATDGPTYYGSSPMLDGLRIPTGHTFYTRPWRDMLLRAHPGAFSSSPTFPKLTADPAVVTSPVLDRLGVTWFATAPSADPIGRRAPGSLADASCGEPAGAATTAPRDSAAQTAQQRDGMIEAGDGLRGVVVRVCEDTPIDRAALVVQASDGVREAEGRVRVRNLLAAGEHVVAVPGDELAGPGLLDVSVALEGGSGTPLPLATTADGPLALDPIRPGADGLQLAYADELRIYRRTTGLARIHWAGRSEVIAEPTQRLDRLASTTLPDDTVVLDDRNALNGPASQGDVIVETDEPDRIELSVAADGSGYVVIADAIQEDWTAQLDGEQVDLVPADHAGVAILTPAGSHHIDLSYQPRGQRAGLAISGLTAAALAAAALLSLRRQRRTEPRR